MSAVFDTAKRLLPSTVRDRYRQSWLNARFAARNIFGRALRLFHRPARPPRAQGLNLHLGCGHIIHPAFVNVDGAFFPHVHHIRPLDDLSNFADATVDFLYASHCLEHFEYGNVPRVLREWRRVLRPGGIARISVPDFDTMVDVYIRGGRKVQDIEVYLLGGHGNKYNYHLALFNEARLSSQLIEAGFSQVRRWERDQDGFASMPDASGMTIRLGEDEVLLSLNLEGVR